MSQMDSFFFVMIYFPQHYKMPLKSYHFICPTVYHKQAVFKSHVNVLGSFWKHKPRFLTQDRAVRCFYGDAEIGSGGVYSGPLLNGLHLLLVLVHLEILGVGIFLCL